MTHQPPSFAELQRQLRVLRVSKKAIRATGTGARDVREVLRRLGERAASWSLRASLPELTRFQISKILEGNYQELVYRHWILRKPIKEGGQGKVIVARDSNLNRLDVVKLLGRCDPVSEERFRREVLILAESSDSRLPRVNYVGRRFGTPYFVMQYIEGENLEELIRARKQHCSLLESLDWAHQVCSALVDLHGRDVVHRDVKPANTILTKAGRLILVDLGIARIDAATTVTEAGAPLGTAHYMSPEQFEDASKVTAASDIYSLGCTLCYLLTGAPPFTGDWERLKQAHRTETPPRIADRGVKVPEKVETLIQRMLAKQPVQRVRSARSLRATLSGLIDDLHSLEDDEPAALRFWDGDTEATAGGTAVFTRSARLRRKTSQRVQLEMRLDEFCNRLTKTLDSMRRFKQQGR